MVEEPSARLKQIGSLRVLTKFDFVRRQFYCSNETEKEPFRFLCSVRTSVVLALAFLIKSVTYTMTYVMVGYRRSQVL